MGRRKPATRPSAVEKERAFAAAYVELKFNAKAAAISIGIPEASAGSTGSDFLNTSSVQEMIQEIVNETRDQSRINILDLIEEWRRIGFSNILHFIRIEEGQPVIDFSAATEAQLAAVQSIEVIDREIRGTEGEVIGTEKRVRFKLHPKVDALMNLSKIFKLYDEKAPQVVQQFITNDNRTQTVVVQNAAEAAKDYQKMLGRG